MIASSTTNNVNKNDETHDLQSAILKFVKRSNDISKEQPEQVRKAFLNFLKPEFIDRQR